VFHPRCICIIGSNMATIDSTQLSIIANVCSYILQLYKAAIIRWWIYARLAFVDLGFVSISVVKPTICTISQIYFILEQHLHVSDGLSVHHQESKTVNTASYHTGLWLLASKQPQNLYDMSLMLYMQS